MPMTDAKTQTFLNLLLRFQEKPRSVGLDDDGAERWQAIVAKIYALARPVATETDAIMNDPKLSDQGKQTKLMSVGPRVVTNFKNLGIVLSEADKAKARLETLAYGPLTTRPTSGDATERQELYARERERRDDLRAMSDAELVTVLLKAVDADDDRSRETVRAMLTAPGGPMVSEDIISRAQQMFAKRTVPEVLARLKAIEVLRDNLEVLATQTAQWLRHLGATPEAIAQAVKE